ncbi:eukaryotic translation initiation factor 2a [Moniliophthora roreri]|nr:eukaryotic translation initiation factor 2a [Moniliophthora roreri]
MSAQISQQYAFRAQKSLGLVGGSPDYKPVQGFIAPDVTARTYNYSADGRLYAYALPSVVRIFQAEDAQLLQELPIPNVIEFSFSPQGTYIATWERPIKLEDPNQQHKNLRIFSVSTGEELFALFQKSQPSEGWDLQYTTSESHAVRLVGQEIQVFRPAEWDKGVVDKLRVEGASGIRLSGGLNPSVAVFVPEKKGAPASVKVYALVSLSTGTPTCQKTFYKSDRCQLKWNLLGTQVLVLTQTDVDNSNKSYYGETGLYLLSAAGNFDCRVTLDKEGPIHDFAWSPNSKEFGVVYGYMPAKTTLFDQRVRAVHSFDSAPYNFISFNPQGRFLALAGFGNLAGKIDIYDRRNLSHPTQSKISTIDAPNTSHCEWSPDGRFLLTATLSPRLRVDNGIKIWHAGGTLVHVQLTEELYQASWRPTPIDQVPPIPNSGLGPAPEPSDKVKELEALGGLKKSPPPGAKPMGAYRPPGARGLATPAIFKREDEGGSKPPSGASTPQRGYSPAPNASGRGGRYVPGAATNGHEGRQNGHGHGHHSPSRPANGRQNSGGKEGGKEGGKGEGGKEGGRKRNKGAKKGNQQQQGGENANVNGNIVAPEPVAPPSNLTIEPELMTPVTPGGGDSSLDPIAKKVRNLNKKLKAIEELKEKAKRGERLEATQIKKMEGEAEIRKELSALGVTV